MTARKQLYHLLRGYLAGAYTPKKFCKTFKNLFDPGLRGIELPEQEYAEFERLFTVVTSLSAESIATDWTEAEGEALRGIVAETLQKLREMGGGVPLRHDEAVCRARELISDLSVKELAKDFLYGVAHNAPEYRTALASYYYIKNLPEHEFQKLYIGYSSGRDYYDPRFCEVCSHYDCRSDTDEDRFRSDQVHLEWFYKLAMVPFYFRLNLALVFLEEYRDLPRPPVAPSDYEHFKRIVAVIESAPEKTTPGKLRKELKASKLLSMTIDQISAFVDMLGYLNILHPDDCFGVTVKHTRERERKDPPNIKTDFAYPVNCWTRKCGVDYDSISMLFDGIYD